MTEVLQTSGAEKGLKVLNLLIGELSSNSEMASTNIKKSIDSIKVASQSTTTLRPNNLMNAGTFGQTSKQATVESDKIVNRIQQINKNLEKLKDTSSLKSLGDKLKEAWDNLSWMEILTASVLGVIGPPGSGTSVLIQGAMTGEDNEKQKRKYDDTDIGVYSPQPGATDSQAAPLKSATSGTLAADLPEGSWTAFLDKTAKVFDEALKAVIKGFDQALAKLVAGEGRRFAQVFAT